jgi:hypothetical protein
VTSLPSLEQMPPDMHLPTPRPAKSLFHEMMVSRPVLRRKLPPPQGDNTLSDLAMHSTHLLMKGVKNTMDFANFFNPFQWAHNVAKPFMEFMDN